MRRRAHLDTLAVLAVDAHITPWQARDLLTIEEADAIARLLKARQRNQ
ncbi:hypothetical protein [Actinomyces urogenitalis]|jgi:hypothetical protein|nr:hypothetical protein [Actinomyces urogenitalis]DAM55041.1 MAG TPA: hypothetical protein [Caudoviricetes sp.]MBS5978056.1 hypothetical protein [Actinomyces urogenitalis]MDU0865337.1 hypothetical protein [Actinomyces urogenitalis]MDU0875792.1 hypothetical protein [Actinomyces urogenitalis]MDU1565503.1 hypothetical protein [Actinomyces urogenitalis]